MEKSRKINEITEGVIWKQLIRFFIPIMLGAFFQQLYNTADTVIVGQFAGKTALASVGGSAGQIMYFVIYFFMGLSMGATVIISQYYGAGDRKRVQDALHTSYAFSAAGGLLLGVIGPVVTVPVLKILDTPEELMHETTVYVRILLAGIVFTFIYNMGSGILRAAGDSKRPLYVLAICCIINIGLDIILVVYLKMGVMGAAIATVISQAVSAGVISWILARRTESMQLSLSSLRIDSVILRRLLRIGIPSAVTESMFCIPNLVLTAALNRMGVDVVAAWTAYCKIDAFWWMIDQAFASSVTTFVGQNYGEMKPDRVRKATGETMAAEIVLGVIASLIFISFGQTLMSMFTDDISVVEKGISIARLITPFYPIFAVFEILSATLRAENVVIFSTVMNLLGVCVFRIIWVFFIFPDGSAVQVLSCFPVSWCIIASVITVYYLIKQPGILASLKESEDQDT